MRPVNPGVATARVPIDAALGGENVVAFAVGFLAFPAAAGFVEFGLSFEDGALCLRGELGLQLGFGGGEFGVNGGLLEGEE